MRVFALGGGRLALLSLLAGDEHLRSIAGGFLPGSINLAVERNGRGIRRISLGVDGSFAARGGRQLISLRPAATDLLPAGLSAARIASGIGLI